MTISNYERYFVPDCVSVTCETFGRQAALSSKPSMHLMRPVLGAVKRRHPFQMLGFVFLPDHAHLLIKPADGVTLDQIMHDLFNTFEHDHREMMGIPSSAPVWQRSYRKVRVHEIDEFADRLDFIHYNPVDHGLAERPEEWPHSSYAAWVERNVYKLGWGWETPERLTGKRWE